MHLKLPASSGFPSQKTIDVELTYMAWPHHDYGIFYFLIEKISEKFTFIHILDDTTPFHGREDYIEQLSMKCLVM